MRYIVALLLILVGGAIGLAGDYPIDSRAYVSLPLMIVGGLLVSAGLATLLLSGGKTGGSVDEPPGYIRP